ncbi:hypothetical protein UFOVP1304_40 [uncultured Caudovirales phage]|uniref:Uncharacterized protein n=1 Tax=uncultured Caudovirales phage TaxID=2100421 RepID=A0A6J5RSK2_9CAUD|nr:hypothetical protein UFOVP1304_40 [uncultured Caudovirales phage]
MSLPRAVIEADEKATRLHEELLKSQQPPEQTEETDESIDNTMEESVQISGVQPDPRDDSRELSTKDSYEHRFRVLQGKYNSEVPRLSAENKELKGTLRSVQDQLDEIKASKDAKPLVGPEEIEEYGEGLIDVARRIAREELSAKDLKIKKLEDKLDTLEGHTNKSAERDFYSMLSAKVPDWEKINGNKAFHSWLDANDELTGFRRQELLSDAERTRDTDRVAKFFTAFKRTSKKQVDDSSLALETQLTPSNTRTPNTPTGKKIWTRAEIGEFYKNARSGKISDKDTVAIESDIHAASVEGRIR